MGKNYLGTVTAPSKIIDVTLTLDTNAYASGDLMADAQEIPNTFGTSETFATGVLQSLTLIDKDNNGMAVDLFFTDDPTTWGTENSAVSITDAIADGIMGFVSVATSDYVSVGSQQIAHLNNLSMVLKGQRKIPSLWIAAVARGSGTFAADGIVLRLGFFSD